MRYSRTSLAYKVEEHSEVDNLVNEARKNSRKRKKTSKLFVFICVIYIISLASSLLVRTANISEQNSELSVLKQEYNDLVNENKRLEVAINSSIDLRKVEEIAIAQLGMNKPRQSQIVYISTSPKDFGEVISYADDVSRDGGMFAGILNAITGIFAYSK